jgi:hypothetical protein
MVATTVSAPKANTNRWLAALGTYVRALLAAALTAFLAVFTSSGHFPKGTKDWEAIAWAVLLAVLPVIINALNPKDTRYGIGTVKRTE